ncbi:hypothetical protein TYRP_005985 [Tyrophagus putrescentiae]|nr:hypothetical protein TYRP_005985 [Tyrophagus putrescentiae]
MKWTYLCHHFLVHVLYSQFSTLTFQWHHPNNNEDPKKHSAPHSPVVRKIPSSFDSPVIHTGQYVVKGVAERISQTRIPEEEHNEPKRNSDRRRLERKSDQATVIMAMPDGFIDLQDKKVKNDIKSSIAKTTALNPSNPAPKLRRQLNHLQVQQVTLTCKQLIPTEPKEDTSRIRDSQDTQFSQYSESPAASTFADKKYRKKSSSHCCCCLN